MARLSCSRVTFEEWTPAMPARLVVYDIDLPPFVENRAFDAESMSQYLGDACACPSRCS
jgi:hypothetical protein